MKTLLTQVCAEGGRDWKVDEMVITVPLPDDRHQTIFAEEYERGGVRLLRLYSKLGLLVHVDDRRIRAALRLNWTQLYGSVSIASMVDDGGQEVELLVMCALIPMENLTPALLGLAIDSLAANADRYERHVFGTDKH